MNVSLTKERIFICGYVAIIASETIVCLCVVGEELEVIYRYCWIYYGLLWILIPVLSPYTVQT